MEEYRKIIINNGRKNIEVIVIENEKIFVQSNFLGSSNANIFSALFDGIEILYENDKTFLPAAPIISYFKGWTWEKIRKYCEKRKWEICFIK